MSIADHFEHVPDTGLVRDYDGKSARRQLSVSLVVVALALFVAVIVTLGIHLEQSASTAASQPIGGAPPAYAGRL